MGAVRDNREDDDNTLYVRPPSDEEMTPPEFSNQPFEFNGQWWSPVHYSKLTGPVTGNPDDYGEQYMQDIFRNYGYDLRPRMVNGVAAQPYDDMMRYKNRFSPDRSYFEEVSPFLAAVGAGVGLSYLPGLAGAATTVAPAAPAAAVTPAAVAAPTVATGAAATGGAAAGGAAAGGAATGGMFSGLPAAVKSVLPWMSAAGTAGSLVNMASGGSDAPVNMMAAAGAPDNFYGVDKEVPQWGGIGKGFGTSADPSGNGILNGLFGMPGADNNPVLSGMSWGELADKATGMAKVAGGGLTDFWDWVTKNKTGIDQLGVGVSSLFDIWNKGRLADDYWKNVNMAMEKADPFAPQRPFYQDVLKQSYTDPNFLQNNQTFQAMMNPAMEQVKRTAAAKGYNGSGNLLAELAQKGTETAAKYMLPFQDQTATYAGAKFSPSAAGQMFLKGANDADALDRNRWGNIPLAVQQGLGGMANLFGSGNKAQPGTVSGMVDIINKIRGNI